MDSATATELTNKLRWAIGSTLKEADPGLFKLEYREQIWMASLITDLIFGALTALKTAKASQNGSFGIDRKLIDSVLTQEVLTR